MIVYLVTGNKLKITNDISQVRPEWQSVKTPPDEKVLDFITLLTESGGEIRTERGVYRCDDLTAVDPIWYLIESADQE